MPEHTIRGTITFPFEAHITADAVGTDFDLAQHYGVPESLIGFYALEDEGPLSSFPDTVTIHDRDSAYTIDAVEVI